jgi:hypothetical protein
MYKLMIFLTLFKVVISKITISNYGHNKNLPLMQRKKYVEIKRDRKKMFGKKRHDLKR